MAAFQYIALNDKGREEKGTLEADSSRQARQILRDKGLSPLTVDVTREEKASNNFLTNLLKPSLSVRELALVTRQLATLIAAGLPVEEAILAVSKQSENPKTQAMLAALRSKVMEGYSLANSLAEYPRAFPNLYRATVAAGESAGHLDLVLNRLADFTESQHESRQRIQQAMVYPVILFVLTLAILAGLLGYVVPDIVKVFADTGQELPGLTIFIISLSDFVVNWGAAIVV
jgi:general secretion pathway protein F